MVDFSVNCGKLVTYLEKCAANGVVLLSATTSEKRNFFNYFYMNIEDGQIMVAACDSEEKKMWIKHILGNVKVKEKGVFAVSDVNLLITTLRSIPTSREISFKILEGNILQIETVDEGTYYGYHLRLSEPGEDTQIALQNSKIGVADFLKIYKFDKGMPAIIVPQGKGYFNTIIKFKKDELRKIIKDTITLTRDQDIKFSIMDGKTVIFETGKESDEIKSKTIYSKEITDPIEFKGYLITNLHPIIKHLFNDVTFFCRIAKADNELKFWIQSKEDDIELNFLSASVVE